jgi:hypothetical protein
MSHQLINFNIPTSLKDCLDEITKAKRISRTAIINQLLEGYCRAELEHIERPQYAITRSHSHAKHQEDDGLPLTPSFRDHEPFEGGWSL